MLSMGVISALKLGYGKTYRGDWNIQLQPIAESEGPPHESFWKLHA